MKTYHQLTEELLHEGFKNIAKKFGKIMQDFHAAKDVPMDLNPIIQQADWMISVSGTVKGTDDRKEKIAELKKFVKEIKTINTSDHKDRQKLCRIQKKYGPLLVSFNLGKFT